MMLLRLPSSMVSISQVDLTLSTLPSASSILLSLLASLVLLAFIRAAFLFMRSQPSPLKPGPRPQEDQKLPSRPQSSFGWGLIRWDSLPALPLSLAAASASIKGSGVGMGAGVATGKSAWRQQNRGPGPTFEHPSPALYQTHVPVSMAKMIMSRHILEPITIDFVFILRSYFGMVLHGHVFGSAWTCFYHYCLGSYRPHHPRHPRYPPLSYLSWKEAKNPK
ncbi:hypothetical protein K443DRAFT_132947 [Laccaria amethystina LaAM-08-1]|uniref:Unplaced genomic scaffold K443scaffold_106, whole genome shotgun sequence n=1 Tax=Laccaria amethystina LaAM-08-1 TaxID=1095629 RepID=A0A0C9XPZ6_9AGAR|nr:hypothetical protein K443DRAFT_132947 [Laccaria amethystina LaAM-08-1]